MRIEALAELGVTEAAWDAAARRRWRQPGDRAGQRRAGAAVRSTGARRASAPASGGVAVAAGGATWRRPRSCSPGWPPCRPVTDFPAVDVERESRHDRRFSLARLLSEFRRPLLARAGCSSCSTRWPRSLGPVLVKTGIDGGVATGSAAVLFGGSAIFLAVTLADLVDQIGETFVTGRTAERIMLSLRIRIWAQLQRLSLDYYEREMAGRIMTRMTTDVDQFESLIENGLLSALVSHRHLRRRRRGPGGDQSRARAC